MITAVQWLKQQYIERGETLPSGVFQEALEMEREQIVNAVEYGCSDWGSGKDAEQYYNEKYKHRIDKAQWLRDNGWYTLWSDDNWLQRDRTYSNPDWAGMSTENAYEYAMNHPNPSTIAEVEEWERRNNKNVG